MTITDRIEVNPGVMLGKPVIRGTRIPVELLLRKLADGATEADLLEAYPRLTRDDDARSSLGATVVSVVAEFGDRLRTAFVVREPGRARLSRTL